MERKPAADPQLEIYRHMAPWQRLEAARELYWLAREIIKQREKAHHPELSPDDLEKRVRSFF